MFAGQSLSAQQSVLKGKVKDNRAEVPYVKVEIKNIDNLNDQQYIQSDSLGYYRLPVRQNSRYTVKFSHPGYNDYTSDTINISSVQKEYVLDIFLEEKSRMVQEIVITGKKKILEADKGKLTFNVENSALTTGQTALDMLKKLPGVTVGQNEEIIFRGVSAVSVMIDGKMTYLSGSQLANYLKGMSAEDIKKIELITAPSAEFDAAGNAGIINIISKRSLKKGYAVDLRSSVSYGRLWMTNQNLSASLRTERLSLYGSFDYNTPHSYRQNKTLNTINDKGNLLQLDKDSEVRYKIKYYTWRAGTEWQFLPKHKIGVAYHGYLDDFKSSNSTILNRINKMGKLHSYLHSDNNIHEPYHYNSVLFNYQFDVDSLGKKITADASHTSYRNFSDGLMATGNYSPDGSFQQKSQQKSHQPGFIKITSVKADADLPFKKFNFKTGIKYVEIENDNQFRFDSLQAGNFVKIEAMSNHFKYREQIAAAYVSGSRVFGKTTLDAGLRLEQTHAYGYTVKQDITNRWKYITLFPSISISQFLNESNKLNVSFSRRINRPSYADLNPVRWYSDPYFYYSGNPGIVPELAWISSLSYSLKSKYIFSASYNQSVNYINRRLIIDDNGVSIKSQSDNFGKRHRFDFTASVPFKPFPFWEIQLFSELSHTSYPISQSQGDQIKKLWALSASLQQDLSLSSDFSINLAAYFYSSELRGIYITKPTGSIDLGIKKYFMDKKLVAQLSVNDVFNTNRYRARSLSDITDYRYNDKPYSRIIGLSFKYHFGGEMMKSSSKKTEEQERL